MRKTVLVVDDDADCLQMMDDILGPQGFRVFTCSDPKQAYEMALDILPDVVLIDLLMPGVNGFQVIEQIRADPTVGECHIIVCTAYDAGVVSRAAWLRKMCCDVLVKPFELDDLFYLLEKDTSCNYGKKLA